ncbi:hypothetical protein JM93_00972 [Roseibium hamelinense]|uniref:Uncharacterized protein n=1 Tax=Roseibium hamelinense TaxID=150831 RepID=A0A562TIE6_9HYPH|nr:hypothetical protein [Roseibium hamelinense]MTI42768.1 hypothetical protein [Roseibium hamelinense]TWI93415.1 hypothetical protein JM93_00972 [Roseibium hamelinense]
MSFYSYLPNFRNWLPSTFQQGNTPENNGIVGNQKSNGIGPSSNGSKTGHLKFGQHSANAPKAYTKNTTLREVIIRECDNDLFGAISVHVKTRLGHRNDNGYKNAADLDKPISTFTSAQDFRNCMSNVMAEIRKDEKWVIDQRKEDHALRAQSYIGSAALHYPTVLNAPPKNSIPPELFPSILKPFSQASVEDSLLQIAKAHPDPETLHTQHQKLQKNLDNSIAVLSTARSDIKALEIERATLVHNKDMAENFANISRRDESKHEGGWTSVAKKADCKIKELDQKLEEKQAVAQRRENDIALTRRQISECEVCLINCGKNDIDKAQSMLANSLQQTSKTFAQRIQLAKSKSETHQEKIDDANRKLQPLNRQQIQLQQLVEKKTREFEDFSATSPQIAYNVFQQAPKFNPDDLKLVIQYIKQNKNPPNDTDAEKQAKHLYAGLLDAMLQHGFVKGDIEKNFEVLKNSSKALARGEEFISQYEDAKHRIDNRLKFLPVNEMVQHKSLISSAPAYGDESKTNDDTIGKKFKRTSKRSRSNKNIQEKSKRLLSKTKTDKIPNLSSQLDLQKSNENHRKHVLHSKALDAQVNQSVREIDLLLKDTSLNGLNSEQRDKLHLVRTRCKNLETQLKLFNPRNRGTENYQKIQQRIVDTAEDALAEVYNDLNRSLGHELHEHGKHIVQRDEKRLKKTIAKETRNIPDTNIYGHNARANQHGNPAKGPAFVFGQSYGPYFHAPKYMETQIRSDYDSTANKAMTLPRNAVLIDSAARENDRNGVVFNTRDPSGDAVIDKNNYHFVARSHDSTSHPGALSVQIKAKHNTNNNEYTIGTLHIGFSDTLDSRHVENSMNRLNYNSYADFKQESRFKISVQDNEKRVLGRKLDSLNTLELPKDDAAQVAASLVNTIAEQVFSNNQPPKADDLRNAADTFTAKLPQKILTALFPNKNQRPDKSDKAAFAAAVFEKARNLAAEIE